MIWLELKLLVTMVAARFGAARDEDNEEGFSVFGSWADLAVFRFLWSIPNILEHWARLVKAICGVEHL